MGDPRKNLVLAFLWHSRALAWLLLWLANIGLVLGYFGWLVAPFDVFSHLRTHLIGAGLISGFALLLPRFTQLVTVAGCVIVVLAHSATAWVQQDRVEHALDQVSTFFGASKANASFGQDRVLSLLSYNTWHSNKDLKSLAHMVLREDADVVVLAEFGPNKRKLLQMWRPRYPYQAHCSDVWQCSVVILSKRPWTAHKIVQREETRSPLVMVRFGEGVRSTTIAATHLYRPIDGVARQFDEIQTLLGELKDVPGALVLAGDFNATRWSHAYKTLERRAGLRSANVFAPTWPRWLPQLAIEHIFTRGGAIAFDTMIVSEGASDHLALRTKILLSSPVPHNETRRAKSKTGRVLR